MVLCDSKSSLQFSETNMRKAFGADAGVPMPVMYALVAALIAIAVVGSISNEQRLEEEAAAKAAAETPAPASTR